jgi:hypothetical protein
LSLRLPFEVRMFLLRPPRCGCGAIFLLALAAAVVVAQEPRGQVSNLVTISARSEYPQPLGAATNVSADKATNVSADDTESTSAAATNYLQYEPQNAPLAEEPPPFTHEVPPVAAPPAKPMPPIAPYSTQVVMTWNSGTGDTLGIVDLDLRETLVFPKVPGLLLTPGFASHILSGPESTDLPPVLYDTWIELRWLRPLNDNWTVDVAVTPGVYTDYDNLSSDAVRIQGRALAVWKARTDLQIAFGFVYLDREDIAALPAAGLIWTPNADWKTELLFPRPRLLYRLKGNGTDNQWLYLAGEFGGGSWAIRRPGNAGGPLVPPGSQSASAWDDIVTYSVLRVLVGWEVQRAQGFSPRIEAGFSFHRSIEYLSGLGDFDLDPAAMVRVGGSF